MLSSSKRIDFFESLIHKNLTNQNFNYEIDRIISGFGCDYLLMLNDDYLSYLLKGFCSILDISPTSFLSNEQIKVRIKCVETIEDFKDIIGIWSRVINDKNYEQNQKISLQIYGAFSPSHIGHLAICEKAIKYCNERYHGIFNQINVCICPLKFHPAKPYLKDTYLDRIVELRNSFRRYNDLLVIDIEGDCTLPKLKQIHQLEIINIISGGYIPQLIFGGDVFLSDLENAQCGSKYSLLDRVYMDLYVSPRADDNVELLKLKIDEAVKEYGSRFFLMPQTEFDNIVPSSTYARKMIESIGYSPIAIK